MPLSGVGFGLLEGIESVQVQGLTSCFDFVVWSLDEISVFCNIEWKKV